MFYILSNIILHLIKFSYLVDLSLQHLDYFRLFLLAGQKKKDKWEGGVGSDNINK